MTDGPAPGSDAPDDHYNPIFERLYDREGGRLAGFVAYGIYKIAKREWAADIREQHGRAPNQDELKHYIGTWTLSRLDGLRQEADQALGRYAEEVVEEARPQILREALQGSFWRSVGASITAATLYTLILIALAVIAAVMGVDLLNAFKALGGGG